MKRLLSILFWSVLSAAFIGPGTVTVASSAGHQFGLDLLWALTFSTLACVVLQEASARIALCSGRDLGQALRHRYDASWGRFLVLPLVVVAVVVGCAAYQAGNILGGVAGAELLVDAPGWQITLLMGLLAGTLLWFGSLKWVALILGGVVALMGAAFLATACWLGPGFEPVLKGALLPRSPAGSGLLVLGLVGTTVVPYNLFLGSGLARGQKLGDLRFGLIVAIVLGGLVSMGVVVVGTTVVGEFSIPNLSAALSGRLGSWAGPCFAVGLFAAGLSSAITAPLAAAITARSLFSSPSKKQVMHRRSPGGRDQGAQDAAYRWIRQVLCNAEIGRQGPAGRCMVFRRAVRRGPPGTASNHRSPLYRTTWLAVLLTGVAFGVLGQKPVPVILVAQAFNGVLLPFVAIFLLFLLNDRSLVGAAGLNRAAGNALLALVIAVTVLLGLTSLLKAGAKALERPLPDENTLLLIAGSLTAVAALLVVPRILRLRERN